MSSGDAAAGPPTPAPAWRIAALSALILALELAFIRQVPAEVRAISYFTNLVLIASFFGLGLGCLLQRWRTVSALLPAGLLLVLGFVLYARGMSPLLVAPGVALITALMYATHIRTGPLWLLWSCCAASVIVPLALETAGAVSTTTTLTNATLTMQLPAEHIDQTVAFVGLGGYVCVILAGATLLSRLQAKERRAIQRKVQLQSWQLAQLIPTRAS